MWNRAVTMPEQVPVLSRGKHRSPRRGACFMEMASYLAGERWTDHPACTHPLLAALARGVNDFTSDEARSRLAVLVPSVIGLDGTDPRVDARVALVCAQTALPVVAAERQRVMAVAILSCERVLGELDGLPPEHLGEASRTALGKVPDAERWARRYIGGQRPSLGGFRRHAAPAIVANAVKGIAAACISNADELLHDMLLAAIDDCARLLRPHDGASAVAADAAGARETSGAARGR